METLLSVPQGDFQLHRYPKRSNDVLRAWDAADELLLNHCHAHIDLTENTKILIVNDSFGALGVCLANHSLVSTGDSYLSEQALIHNLEDNAINNSVQFIDSLGKLPSNIDLVVLKIPKNLGLLEDQLIRIKPLLAENGEIILAGMVKHMPASIWALVERIIGKTVTSKGIKKAKMISATADTSLPLPDASYPKNYPLEGTKYIISNHANVFSRQNLDIGTRFFIQHLPDLTDVVEVADLGCGNGIVGLVAASKSNQVKPIFIDESYMAVASAKTNFTQAFGAERPAEFLVADGLSQIANESIDCVLCNPPFHHQNTITDQIAMQMFKDAKRTLRAGGELWVIGNRHLGYKQTLKNIFNHVDQIATNKKFVVLRCRIH